MRRLAAPLIALVVVLAGAAQAAAAPQPEVRIFVGAKIPSSELRGATLNAAGKGTILRVAPGKDRATGKSSVLGSFAPDPAKLTAIRTAAKGVYANAKVTIPAVRGEMYAAVTVQIGTKQRTALGLNGVSPQVKALIDALNAALPPDRFLPVPDGVVATKATTFPEAKCAPGETATTASREVPLKDAAKAGMVKFTSKGKISGDNVKVEGQWKPVKGPVKLRFNIELVDSGPSPSAPSPAAVAGAIEGQLNGKLKYKGQPITVDVTATRRSSTDPPTPCFHQIYFYADAGRGVRDHIDGLDGLTNQQPQGGDWSWGRPDDATIWAHETMHLAGLDDQYRDYLQVGGKEYPVPPTVDGEDRKALEAWAKSKGIDLDSAKLHSVPHKGHENDLMGSAQGGFEVPESALAGIWARSAKIVTIHGDPGDILLNHDAQHQNMGVGAPFDMTVSPGHPAVKEGLVAFCIDLQDHGPAVGDVFDVLGNAKDLPLPGMAELARVLTEGAARQQRPLEEVRGLQFAVWRVTNEDGSSVLTDAQADILRAAQIPAGVDYGTPHFETPNAGSPDSASVTNGAVDPTVPEDPAVAAQIEAQAKPPKPVLERFVLTPKRITRDTRVLTATVELANAGDRVRLRLFKQGRRKARRTSPRRTLREGATSVAFLVPKLSKGRYTVRLTGAFGQRSVKLRVSG